MPTLDLTEQEINIVLNILALQNPLIHKITQQVQEQNNGSLTTERSAAPVAGPGSLPSARALREAGGGGAAKKPSLDGASEAAG